MKSIRARITFAVVGCTATVVAVAALIAGTTATTMLSRDLEERLRARVRRYSFLPRNLPFPRGETPPRDPSASDPSPPGTVNDWSSGFRFEVRDAATHELLMGTSAWMGGTPLADFGAVPGEPARTIDFDDGRPYRLLAVAIDATLVDWSWHRWREREAANPPTPPEHRAVVVYVAGDAADLEAEAHRLYWILGAVWAGATALAWTVSLWLSRAVLQPVGQVSRSIEALAPTGDAAASLSPTDLSKRVEMTTVPDELRAVVLRLNALLDRLDSAFQRERATLKNLAHELRTPLSALRTTLEFGLFRKSSPEDRRTLEQSLALALRMQSLVTGLLTLTRIEARQETLTRAPVDLIAALHEAWSPLASRAEARGLSVAWHTPDDVTLVTSPTHVALVASNLLDNAVSHAAAPGEIEVDVSCEADATTLRVSNACKNDRRGETSNAAGGFTPLWRSDTARASDGHFGLGLALCDRIVRLLGGTIEIQHDERRFTVLVRLGVAAAAAAR